MDVIGFDMPVMDFLIGIDKIPASNTDCNYNEYSWQGGGGISSAIVASSRLGAMCGMIGKVGNDSFGNFCINDFKRHGIDTSHIVIDKDFDTNFTICLAETSTKMRSFIHCNFDFSKMVPPEDLDRNYIASSKFIHIGQINQTTVQAAKWAKECGVKVSFDAGGFRPEIEDYLNLIDVFIASEFYYNGMFDDKDYEKNCRRLQEKGPEIVVITLGEKGSVGLQNGDYFEMPTFNEIKVVDSTGAGDVFHGAFIYGLIQGWDAKKTARFASAVSSIKCTKLGGRAGIPDLSMVERFLEDGFIDNAKLDERVRFYKNGLFELGAKL